MKKIKQAFKKIHESLDFTCYTIKLIGPSVFARFTSFLSTWVIKLSNFGIPAAGILFSVFFLQKEYIPLGILISIAYPIFAHYVLIPELFRWNMKRLQKAQEHMDYIFAKDIHDSIKKGDETREDIIQSLTMAGYDQYKISHIMLQADSIED